uniref:potassium channel subfamily U member 1 n=1 Tax=Jaculus jaculus TaxID=51337 RepID=UPI001E1B43E4|nr:potassium channel subfamily U member 1 [Jaculus jaculus]
MYQRWIQSFSSTEVEKISCTIEIQAAFVLSSVVTFFGGLIILITFRLLLKCLRKCQRVKGAGIVLELSLGSIAHNPLRRLHFYGVFRNRIEILLSAQTFVGQVLAIAVFVLSIGSLIIYFINSTHPVGKCSLYEDKTMTVDLLFNAFFTFYFGLRFWAATDKIKFWLEMNSIVDIFTIPPIFISYHLKSNWLGLRFLRALRLLELPQILQILRVTKTSNSLKLSKLLSVMISTWFTAAGFLHLVENSGDPWLKGRNSQTLSYFESIYLVTATMSTVGFGDVVAKTSLGRIFIVFFTLGSLVLFANFIPEMVELFVSKKKYTRPYQVVKGKKFIVVCGNITVDSVTALLRNFLCHKSGEINTEIVFLGETNPSLELETIFKCYLAYTTFVCGSALKCEDLKRVGVEYAEACLIVANSLCSNFHEEDTSNIMRVLSIKNYYPQTRVIIQILQSHNKVFLPKIPSWNWNAGDNIICFAELNLGFIAQGCLVPGLCTFLTSLFVEQTQKVFPKKPWQKHFLNGLKNKILTQRLSDDFVGMTFPEVSRLCFMKMHLLLIAIQQQNLFRGCCSGLILNPPPQVRLQRNTLGFFIAESLKDVKRAAFYCSTCHGDVCNPELISKCSCKARSQRHHLGTKIMAMNTSMNEFSTPVTQQSSTTHTSMLSFMSSATSNHIYESLQDSELLDTSGMFHWCKTIPLEKVILKRTDKLKYEFQNHIVACVFGDAHSTLMGLRNFVMPLRASNYTRKELKDIVFIGSLDYLKREWPFLQNFPQLYIMPGSALYSGDLYAVNIEHCSMCVILATPIKQPSSQSLVDSETIMATLNVGSLQVNCSAKMPAEFCKLLIRVCLSFLLCCCLRVFSAEGTEFHTCENSANCRQVPILTELKNPSNIHFIEQIGGLEGPFTSTSLLLSTAFSTGAVFSGNFLDSLLASAFYNYHVLDFLQMLVTGGISFQGEHHLVKEKFCTMHDSSCTLMSSRTRCKLGLLSLDKTILSEIKPRTTFGQLFCGSLDNLGILCVGLYRMIDEEERDPQRKRGVFVITRPANEFLLLPSDLVFCAIPFNIAYYKNNDVSSSQILDEITNAISVKTEKQPDTSHPLTVDILREGKHPFFHARVHSLELNYDDNVK